MLHLNYTNILKNKVGSNGISEKYLRNFCNRKQLCVKDVLRNKKRGGYDFLNLPDDNALLRKIKKLTADHGKYGWQNIVVLGIGGSSLGLAAIKRAILGPSSAKKPKLIIIDNIDPDYTESILSGINISKSLFIVISKSGGTTEPMVLYGIVKQRLLEKCPKDYQKNFIFITDPKKGLLRKIGKKEGITMFDIPPKVGGRFSVLSGAGLVPAALAGVDVAGLLKGGKTMREALKSSMPENNQALILASIQYILDKKRGKNITVVMPYSSSLFKVGVWYRQLLAESIGKNSRTGPTPVAALGTTDQHSQLQLFNEGPNNKFLIFLKILKYYEDPALGDVLPEEIGYLNNKKMSQVIDAAYTGTAESLTKNGRPNVTIEIPKIDERHLGMLFMLFEFQMALLGLLYKVDAFDQPGVEESKLITKKLLSE